MEDALHEIEMCFSQLEQVGQGPIAGEMAMRLNRLLMPSHTWTLEWQCFNAAAERAQELYARTTPAASRNWERGVSPGADIWMARNSWSMLVSSRPGCRQQLMLG